MTVFQPNPKLDFDNIYSAKDDPHLNALQKAHLAGDFDVYNSLPQENARDLPPVAFQWKQDYQRRFKRE